MVKSMTGYGKAECLIAGDKYQFEIRSVNGKNADITLKTSLIPREKEMEVRSYIASALGRGNIDMFAGIEKAEGSVARNLNKEVVCSYVEQLRSLSKECALSIEESDILPMALRMPDVFEAGRNQELSEEQWNEMYGAIRSAIAALDDFRTKEGVSLKRDVLGQVDKIESYILEVEKYEKQRIDAIRERIVSKLAEIGAAPDHERLEQEMIFYIEKLDINEEKVRLRQHCRYFRETLENEDMPGKKLGFIAQEMGREINTMGSKSNHAQMQKWVVMMKDELEKIKEQTLNIL